MRRSPRYGSTNCLRGSCSTSPRRCARTAAPCGSSMTRRGISSSRRTPTRERRGRGGWRAVKGWPDGWRTAGARSSSRGRKRSVRSTRACSRRACGPLRVGGRVIGVLELIARGERDFRAQDVRLIEAFADRVALAVDNARAYGRQREIAGVIQEALVPTPSVRLPGMAIAGRYVPSREVGGDFYAVLPLGHGRVGLAIADVTGKGIPAATLSARARYLLEAFVLDGQPSEAVVARMNAVLTRDAASGLFVSLFYGMVDPEAGTLRYTRAGHPAPFLLRAGVQAPEALDAPGLLLGVDPAARYPAVEVQVGPGDLLAMFTDGITEARRPDGELFGDQRLVDTLIELREAQPERIADEIMAAVGRWSGDGPTDDQALVIARVLPWGANVGERSAREHAVR